MNDKTLNGASMEVDNAFIPTDMSFTECGTTIRFMVQGESVIVQVHDGSKHMLSMRLPLYAATAFSQMFTQSLNGQRMLK